MRRAILAAALALTATGAAYAQSAQGDNERSGMGAQRTDKQGTNQTYNTGETGSQVGDQTGGQQGVQADTTRTDDMNAARPADYDAESGRRGTGVATGFIAAGLGLALLGLFVRRRNRRDHRFDDVDRPGGPGGIGPRI